MNILSQRSLSTLVIGSVAFGTLALAGTAFAAGTGFGYGGMGGRTPGVVGIVSTINGTSLTVTSKGWAKPGTTPVAGTTYIVDAANATVTKNGTNSSVSAIATGDTLMIQGTVSGSTVTAIAIRDVTGQGMKGQKPSLTQSPLIQGNGQPIVGGTVSAVSGNSVTITNKSNLTYVVDATSAKVTKAGITGATLTSIVVGDSVVIQGTVNGTSITASSVIDQGTVPSKPSISGSPEGTETHGGIMGAIGGFFSHLFGF